MDNSVDGAVRSRPARPLWRNWDFQLLFVGSLTSVVGSEIAAIAYPLLVLAVTGSPAQAGLVAFAETLAAVLTGIPAGALVDRWNKRAVLVTVDAIRLVAAASIPVTLATDRLTLAQIVVVAAVIGAGRSFFVPARGVAIRRAVPPEQLSTALSQNEARGAAANLVGPAAGGALFGLGRSLPFLADAISFAVSLLCVLGVRTPLGVEPGSQPERRDIRADIAEGFRWIWHRPHFRAMLLYSTAVNLAGGALLLSIIVLARADGASPTQVGLVLTVLGVGSLGGAVVSARLQRLLPQHGLMLLCGGVASVCVPAAALPFGLVWLGATIGVVMLFTPAVSVAINLVLMREVPEGLLGRVTSTLILLISVCAPLGPLAAGLLLEYVGNRPTMLVLGGYLLAITLVAALRPNFRHPEVDDHVDDNSADAANTANTAAPETA